MRLLRVAATSILSCALTVACAVPTPDTAEETGRTGQSIVNGTASTAANDSTVLILDGGTPSCTGVLITPNLVLTARHCVTNFDDRSNCGRVINDAPPSVFTVATGPYAATKPTARGAKLYVPSSPDVFCNGNDLALILLDADIPGAKTAKVRFSGVALNDVGTAIGYGEGSTGGRRERNGVKVLALGPAETSYETQNGFTFDQIRLDAGELMVSESTCFGDSGGPLLDADGQIVGIASEGLDDQCVDRPTFYTAITKHEQLIKDAATASGHPLEQGAAPPTGPRNAADDPSNPAKSPGTPTSGGGGDDDSPGAKSKSGSVGSAGCSLIPTTTRSASAVWLELGVAMLAGALLRRRRSQASGTR